MLVTNIVGQIVWRITNEILGVKGLRHSVIICTRKTVKKYNIMLQLSVLMWYIVSNSLKLS